MRSRSKCDPTWVPRRRARADGASEADRLSPLPPKTRRQWMRDALLEVTPVIPGGLARLPELAANLLFSWHRPIRALFEDLDPELWKQTNGNPRLMIRCVNQKHLDRCAHDEQYLGRYQAALETLDAYVQVSSGSEGPLVA